MKKQCQSCGMPLKKASDYGTEEDGSPSETYCALCYVDGTFKNPDWTATDMQKFVVDILHQEKRWPRFLAKLAAKQIPQLGRWKAQR